MTGALLVLVVHRSHCTADHDSHGTGQCLICQIAHTPVVTTVPHVEPVAKALVFVWIDLPQSPTPSAPLSATAQARGPPDA